MYHNWLLLLGIIAAYSVAILVLRRKKVFDGTGLTLWGPIVMWRTERGKAFIDWLAKPRLFWKIYSTVSIVVVVFIMVLMTIVLILSAAVVTQIPRESAPPPSYLIGIPGLNPLIPVTYGILALVITIIIHEFAHGVLTRVGGLTLKSLGAVFLVIPIAAFVEPDEEEMKRTGWLRRTRILSVGPSTNIFFAIICALIFSWAFMGSVEPAADGPLVRGVVSDSPADNASLKAGMIITEASLIGVNGTAIGTTRFMDVRDFHSLLTSTREGDNITLTVYYKGSFRTFENITLANRSAYIPEEDGNEGVGYLGVASFAFSPRSFRDTLAHPISSGETTGERIGNLFLYVVLPLAQLSPLPDHITDTYVISGPWSGVSAPHFWILANTFYWLFWISLMLGLTNALPAVPLDGGHIFRDGSRGLLRKLRPSLSDEERERHANTLTNFASLGILFLILWQIIGPLLVGT